MVDFASLRDLFADAVNQVETYKHPNIDEAKQRMDAILQAACLGGVMRDHITSLHFYRGDLHIETEYYTRGCRQEDSYTIPGSIIDAEDPIYAAKLWAAEKRLATAEVQLSRAISALGDARIAVIRCTDEKNILISNHEEAKPRCCVCDTTENLHKDGWYGYRCDSNDCVCY